MQIYRSTTLMDNTSLKKEKYYRMLALYEKLHKGSAIRKKEEAEYFDVTEKSIQRDIEDLRCFLAESGGVEEYSTIEFDRKKQGYVLCRKHSNWLANKEVMGVVKILLESRAFAKVELDPLLDKLILQSAPEERSYIKEAIRNERHHYVPAKHGKHVLDCLWELGKAIREQKVVTLEYQKIQNEHLSHRIVKPVGIVFSEYYFYLVAYHKDREYEFPAIYRVDRIHQYTVEDEHFSVPYAERFEEGEFRKRVQFMISGKVIKLQFKFWGDSVEAVLDRLPTARIIKKEGKVYLIEAEVFGRGIMMWLLSQGQFIEIMSPDELRQDLYYRIGEMVKIYSK